MSGYFTGDTIRIQGTFRDLNNALTDADGNVVTLKAYNADTHALIASYTTARVSQGIYFYDYTFGNKEMAYIFELSGEFGGKVQLKRFKTKAKFKV